MEAKLIEVTQVTVVSGIAMSPQKRVIGSAYIVAIDGEGVDGTSMITLSTGEKFNVSETYDELKGLLRVGFPAEIHVPGRKSIYGTRS